MLDDSLQALVARYGVGEVLSGCVLVVDDDAPNLAVLDAILGNDYRILTAESGDQALRVLAGQTVDVVVTDQRMPGMSGIELLECMRSLRPDVAGIVLTAYTDTPVILSAINRAQVFRFLPKPWESADILEAVSQASQVVGYRRTINRLVEILSQRNGELSAAFSELKTMQQGLLHMERLGTMGRLTAGITHDLRNFLTGLAWVEEACQGSGVPEDLRETITIGLHGIRNLLSTLETLNQFSRGDSLGVRCGTEAPDVIARNALAVLRMDIAFRRRQLVQRFASDLAPIAADRTRLVQVLVNLLRNAVQATQPNQTITLEVAGTPDGGVLFAVQDEGPGVPESLRGRLFEPFLSTKGAGGMGMGLYMARMIADQHRGRLELVSSAGQGARFELWIPGNGGGEQSDGEKHSGSPGERPSPGV
jgi:signal transduction histidine kinase